MHVARVVVHAVVGRMLVLSARVIVVVFVVEFPQPVFCIWRSTPHRILTFQNEKDPWIFSLSIEFLCSIGVKSQTLVDDVFNLGLAFAAGFPEAFSSSWIGTTSRTNLSIPFTF